jgi:outer membrane immunogenic protein
MSYTEAARRIALLLRLAKQEKEEKMPDDPDDATAGVIPPESTRSNMEAALTRSGHWRDCWTQAQTASPYSISAIVAIELQQGRESCAIVSWRRRSGVVGAILFLSGAESDMRKVLGLVGATVLLVGPALAADLGKPAPAVFSWAGWYIGGNAGYGWGERTDLSISSNLFGNDARASRGFFPNQPSPKGFIGGGQIGYDWQINNWVLGLVADFQGADIDAAANNAVGVVHLDRAGVVIARATGTTSLSEKLDFLGTGRARLGWAANNWLFYGSGGGAYGNVRSTVSFFDTFGDAFAGSHTEIRGGWAAGGGINYAVTPNWNVGVDYLHYDLGHTSVTTNADQFGRSFTASQSVAGDVVRGMVNYKF